MTEGVESMEKKAVQPRNLVCQKNNRSHDAVKRCAQRSSGKSDLKKSGSSSLMMKSQMADKRFQSRISKKNTTKFQNIQLSQETCSRSNPDCAKDRDLECLDIQDDGDVNLKYGKLLNFKFAPTRCHLGSASSKYGKSMLSARSPVYSKEAYLQASCQFVVRQEGDYLVHAIDPDVLVDWNLIEQVCVFSHETISCPICLETPIAAKITRCGHIYCWSCILHYLKLSDKSWRKCPICYEAIIPADLKSVMTTYTHKFGKGEKIPMRLMKRMKGSMLSWPISYQCNNQESFMEWTDGSIKPYSKLLLSDPKTVQTKIINREMKELEKQLANAFFEKSGEECFIECALLKLKEKEKEVLENLHKSNAKDFQQDIQVQKKDIGVIANKMTSLSVEHMVFSLDDNIDKDFAGGAVELPDHTTKARDSTSEFYYFYQAEDGQNIFMQPINVRCLVREYGRLEDCPEKIIAQINNINFFTMTKDLRKRYRYLNHLPVGCCFSLCELMLRPPILSRETLSEFSEEFQTRKMLRQKKKREERKQEQKMERRKTTDVFGREIQRPAELISWNLESFEEFPSQAGDNAVDFPSLAKTAVSPSFWGSSSFSDALQSDSKPLLQPYGSVRSKTYLDTIVRDPEKTLNSDGEIDEDYMSVPSFARAFSDALSAPCDMLDSKKDATPSVQTKGNKKKQRERKLLFSTGGFMKYS